MNTRIEEQLNSITFKRGRGGTWSGDDQWLPDNKAIIKFLTNNLNNSELLIVFGYTSPSGKYYGRELELDISKVIKLRNYLNNVIEESIGKKYTYWTPTNPFIQSKIQNIEAVRFHSILKINNFKYCINRSKNDELIFDLTPSSSKCLKIYLPVYKVERKILTEIEEIYDQVEKEKGFQYITRMMTIKINGSQEELIFHCLPRPFLFMNAELIENEEKIIKEKFGSLGLSEEQIKSNIQNIKDPNIEISNDNYYYIE